MLALTVYQVAGQDQYVLHDICPLGSGLQYADRILSSQQETAVCLGVILNRLFPLLPPDLVYRLDLLEVVLGDRLSSDSSLPRDWSSSDAVLQR